MHCKGRSNKIVPKLIPVTIGAKLNRKTVTSITQFVQRFFVLLPHTIPFD